jgi:protein involved in polysaccharide export with SLBB domain
MAMNANKKRTATPLDRTWGAHYYVAPMARVLGLVFLVVFLAGCASDKVVTLRPREFEKHFSTTVQTAATITNAAGEVVAKPRLIVPGMQLSVAVDEDASLNRMYTVPPSGVVDFAGAGRINVAGLKADEVAQKIRAPLEEKFFNKATVSVTIETAVAGGKSGGVVYVLGAVNRPGPLLLPADEPFTVTKVIIAAANFSAFAKSTKVRLIRYDESGKKYQTYVNVARIMKQGEFEEDIAVQTGDWIIVDEKLFSF